MNLGALIGLTIMVVSEAATLARVEPFYSWNTPICWTGFILFADSLVWRARGRSWIRSSPIEFAFLTIASILLWLVFEFYNLYIDNWHYGGLPENRFLRLFGYAWSFATIWPAIFEGADLMAIMRAGKAGGAGKAGQSQPSPPHPAYPAPPAHPAIWIAAGAAMLIVPFVVPAASAQYMAAPVWLGFIFLLEPINVALGEESLFVRTRPRWDRMVNLAWSGVLCGVLWEFWNYWSRAKWLYTVPILEHVKIFEMPLPGYLGFPAFALECFTMYVFVRIAFTRDGRTVGV